MNEETIVKEFGEAMTAKMLKRRDKYGFLAWRDRDKVSIDTLKERLRDEIQEWEEEQEDLDELVDIAVSALILHDAYEVDRE